MPKGIPDVTLEVVWGPRQATLEECAETSVRFLKRLSPFFSGLRNAKLVARKRQSVQFDVACLKEVLQKGVNRKDIGHEVITEQGYSVGLAAVSSTDPSYAVDVDLNIGVTSSAVPNEVSVSLGTFDPVR